jgi:hypothetical protein
MAVNSPVVAAAAYGGMAVIAGRAIVMTLHARWRRPEDSREFWEKIGVQALVKAFAREFCRSFGLNHATK